MNETTISDVRNNLETSGVERNGRCAHQTDGSMRRPLKIVAWWIGIPATLVMLLLGWSLWHHDLFIYPKVWNAKITVGGGVCERCALYIHRSRVGGVLVRRIEHEIELYSVALPNPNSDVPNGAVWKCVEGAYFFAPGLALHSRHQWCAPWGFPSAQKQIQMESRMIEFTAEDRKRVRAEW